MSKTYKTDALIIKRINLGEADRIVTALSGDYGKIRFVAKGVRKIKSKFAGSIEPFYRSELTLVTGKNLDILSGAEIKETYLTTHPTLAELKVANLVGEIIDRIVPDYEPDPELFSITERTLQSLNSPETAILFFESQFYRHSGVFPHLESCTRCQKTDVAFYSLQANGALCQDCRRLFADSVKVDVECLRFWKEMSENDISEITIPADAIVKECSKLCDRYLATMTTYKFKSILI